MMFVLGILKIVAVLFGGLNKMLYLCKNLNNEKI
jgi:hypothetical protein